MAELPGRIFTPSFQWTDKLQAELEADGYCVLPGVLSDLTTAALLRAAERIDEANWAAEHQPATEPLPPEEVQQRLWAATTAEEQQSVFRRAYGPSVAVQETDSTAGALVAHPDVLKLATQIIGPDACFDSCNLGKRKRGERGVNVDGIGWHTHHYEPDPQSNRFVQIFFYVSGFVRGDSNLLMIPGSHRIPQTTLAAVLPKLSIIGDDLGGPIPSPDGDVLKHPLTEVPLRVERLACPTGSVVVFSNKVAHAVEPKPLDSTTTRWNFSTSWKNEGHTSHRGSMTPGWAQRRVRGVGLLPPVSPRDAVPDGYATPSGYVNAIPGITSSNRKKVAASKL